MHVVDLSAAFLADATIFFGVIVRSERKGDHAEVKRDLLQILEELSEGRLSMRNRARALKFYSQTLYMALYLRTLVRMPSLPESMLGNYAFD